MYIECLDIDPVFLIIAVGVFGIVKIAQAYSKKK